MIAPAERIEAVIADAYREAEKEADVRVRACLYEAALRRVREINQQAR